MGSPDRQKKSPIDLSISPFSISAGNLDAFSDRSAGDKECNEVYQSPE